MTALTCCAEIETEPPEGVHLGKIGFMENDWRHELDRTLEIVKFPNRATPMLNSAISRPKRT
jgi:hypothetical protein